MVHAKFFSVIFISQVGLIFLNRTTKIYTFFPRMFLGNFLQFLGGEGSVLLFDFWKGKDQYFACFWDIGEIF